MKILIVDDHALFREGLIHVLDGLAEKIIILEASGCDQALQHVSDNSDIDLVLLDLNLSGIDGFEVLSRCSQQYSTLPIVILSASNQRCDIQRALDSGAMGYIPKDTTSSIMLNALNIIMAGGIYVPQSMALTNECKDFVSITKNKYDFTPRQLDVLALLVDGYSNKNIAQELQLAEATIKVHITSILKTLGVSNRTQAAMATIRLGLTTSHT